MWKGPVIDGLTQSIINRYIRCPFASYLYLILGLEDDKEFDKNLIWGDCFHKGLEYHIKRVEFPECCSLMQEYRERKYPYAPESFQYSLPKMLRAFKLTEKYKGTDWETEQIIDKQVMIHDQMIRFRGKMDAVNNHDEEFSRRLGEHKCMGFMDPVKVKNEIVTDLQLNIYMYLENYEWVNYDLIKIPDVQKYGPERGYDETTEEWINRLYRGPIGSYKGNYPINSNKHNWIHQATYHLPRESQEKVWDFTIKPLIKQIIEWYSWVTQSGFDHENPKFYNELFYRSPVRHFDGRKTPSFECEYYDYLTGNITLDQLRPVDSYFSELEDEDE